MPPDVGPFRTPAGQLEEMANIVLGIRLFNREIGKGGAGLDAIEDDAAMVRAP
jgi:hypothetical protein